MSYLAMIQRREGQAQRPEATVPRQPSARELEQAAQLLNGAGCRYIVDLETRAKRIGIWSDLDSAELREALRALRIDLPVVYLDSERCPEHYRIRRVPGEPVPLSVLKAMEQAQSEPWRVRDELLLKPLRFGDR